MVRKKTMHKNGRFPRTPNIILNLNDYVLFVYKPLNYIRESLIRMSKTVLWKTQCFSEITLTLWKDYNLAWWWECCQYTKYHWSFSAQYIVHLHLNLLRVATTLICPSLTSLQWKWIMRRKIPRITLMTALMKSLLYY